MTPFSAILILGSSARAAAQSAVRAGYAARAADLFADQDLLDCCPSEAVKQYPQDLLQVARSSPPGDWLYTGGLENHPRLVDAISAERDLLGNPGDVLRRVRDPLLMAAALSRRGINCPAVADSPNHVPLDGTWLCKPRHSAGGQGINVWMEGKRRLAVDRPTTRSSHAVYFQAVVPGSPCSAVYVAAGGNSRLLGVTEQLIGTAWSGAKPFAYAGSVGPWRLSAGERAQWDHIGQALAEEFNLTGLFGVDAIANQAGIWPIEVNPRYCASIEVLERTLGWKSISLHVAACREGLLPGTDLRDEAPSWAGKAILYAATDFTVTDELAAKFAALKGDLSHPGMADIPRVASTMRAGWPICTLLVVASSRQEALARLQARGQQIRLMLAAASVDV